MTDLTSNDNKNPMAEYACAIGIDWADQKHDIALLESPADPPEGCKIKRRVVGSSPEELTNWMHSLQEKFGQRKIAVAVEQKRGPLINFLSSYDFIDIYPVPTRTLKSLRDAFYPSGSKTDPDDCTLILDVLTKHTGHLRKLCPESAEIRELSALCEDRRRWVNERVSLYQALRSACKSYFPVVAEIFDFNTSLVCRFLERWPTHEALRKARPETLRKFFHANSCRGEIVEKRILAITNAKKLTDDPGVIRPLATRVAVLNKQITLLCDEIANYDKQIAELLQSLPSASIFESLPGAAAAMAPRLCVAFGEDRSRYSHVTEIQQYSGTSPVTRQSGKSKVVLFRRAAPTFLRQSFVEWANCSRRYSQWAKVFYESCMERGDKHNTALRKLAYKWQRIIFRMWKNNEPYEEEKYLASLRQHGSPLIARIEKEAA